MGALCSQPVNEWFIACAYGDDTFVARNLERCAGLVDPETQNFTGLIQAIKRGHIGLVDLLVPFEIGYVTQATLEIAGFVDAYRRTRFMLCSGSSALHAAVAYQSFDACIAIAKQLDQDKSLNSYLGLTDDNDFTALELAAATRWPLTVPMIRACPQYFLLCEARVEKLHDFNLLSIAVDFGNYLLVEFLLEILNTPAHKNLVQFMYDAQQSGRMRNARGLLPFIDVPDQEVRLCRKMLQDYKRGSFRQRSQFIVDFMDGKPFEIFPRSDLFLLNERNRERELQKAAREFFVSQRQDAQAGLTTVEDNPVEDQINQIYKDKALSCPWRVYKPADGGMGGVENQQEATEDDDYYSSQYYSYSDSYSGESDQ